MILPWQKKKKSSLDLALVMCPGWGVIQPPVGISYLKSFLEKYGTSVKCFDLSLELYKVFPEKKYWDLNYPEYFIIAFLIELELSFSVCFISLYRELARGQYSI